MKAERRKALITNSRLTCLLGVVLISVLAFSQFWGAVYVPPKDVLEVVGAHLARLSDPDQAAYYIIMEIRMPRTLLVAVTGAVLSLAGVLMQTITHNPLAEPYILGVSTGAGAGAVSAIVLGWFSMFGPAQVYVGAFTGSFLAIALVTVLQAGSTGPVRLLLIGIGISAFFHAVTTLIIYSSNNEAQVRSAMFWTVGSFSGIMWADITLPLAILAILVVFSLLITKELDLLLLGQQAAAQMGLNINLFQVAIVIITSMSVAVIVSKVGVIGFVGLIVPHITRRLSGVRHGPLIAHSALLGAIFLIITDTISRTVFAPQEIPIGVITAFVGAPVFILMVKGMKHGSTS